MADGTDRKSAARAGELFISRAGADKEIAILIAHILRDAGYTTFLQDENFGHTSFMACMRDGFAKVDHGGRMLALLSKAYMQSDYCMAEADFALTGDPSNKKQRLIVLRIEDCVPTGFLKSIPWAYNLVPILHDATALGKAVSGAIDPAAPEANYAAGLKYAPVQILHPEIRPVPGFTGREDLLANLDRALWQKGGAAALTNAQSAAVHGLGGVGKSVLAQEYAWRNHARYRGVWWLRAETEQTLIDDLIALGSRLMPGLEAVPERDNAAQLALDAIAQTGAEKPWLLIYDNAEKPSAIEKLTPRSGAHLIITSRWPGWQGRAEALAVDVFPPEIAIDYLLEGAPVPDRDAAARLADALGYLPLALSHGRAYCTASNLGFDAYRARIAERIKDLPDDADYPRTVFGTFSLAMGKAAAACPEAETLMGIAAFLAPDRIPLDIITADVIGEAELNKAVAALYNVSLITHETLDDGSRGISLHRLVQEVMRARLAERGEAESTAATALRLVAAAFPSGEEPPDDVRNWPSCIRLASHATTSLLSVPDTGEGAKKTSYLCNQTALYLLSRADYKAAAPLMRRALGIDQAAYGPDHPRVAIDLNNLAQLLQDTGRLAEAEPLMRRALGIDEAAYGPDHPRVAIRLNNLAGLLRDTGRFAEAEPLMRRALGIDEAAYGPGHPRVAL
ncbi:MAG: FxSxx-COOH system tetratricopeptide repeat protein, partial [Rhodomicrobiaceae bacterium]